VNSNNFSPDEWEIIKRAPLLVFYYVANADENIEMNEVEQLIKQFDQPDRYESAVFTHVVAEIMANAKELAATVGAILSGKAEAKSQIVAVQEIVDTKLQPEDATAFKEALLLLGMDIAAATGDQELPVSKEEWSELSTFKKLLKL